MDKEDFHILRLMGEIDRNGDYSQRELSSQLNISLGLVNTFLKRLVNKGYFKVKTMPRNRVKYFLTPEGLARKSRLTVEYLRYSLNFYKDIKNLLLKRYKAMEKRNAWHLLFFGGGEVADLAYLYLRLTDLTLVGIVDEENKGNLFFEHEISGFERLRVSDWDMILLTSLEDMDNDLQELMKRGINQEKIAVI